MLGSCKTPRHTTIEGCGQRAQCGLGRGLALALALALLLLACCQFKRLAQVVLLALVLVLARAGSSERVPLAWRGRELRAPEHIVVLYLGLVLVLALVLVLSTRPGTGATLV